MIDNLEVNVSGEELLLFQVFRKKIINNFIITFFNLK